MFLFFFNEKRLSVLVNFLMNKYYLFCSWNLYISENCLYLRIWYIDKVILFFVNIKCILYVFELNDKVLGVFF